MIDDVLVLSEDPIHSDHVEIWLDLLGQETQLFHGAGISDHPLRFSRDANPGSLSIDERKRRMLADFEQLSRMAGNPQGSRDVGLEAIAASQRFTVGPQSPGETILCRLPLFQVHPAHDECCRCPRQQLI